MTSPHSPAGQPQPHPGTEQPHPGTEPSAPGTEPSAPGTDPSHPGRPGGPAQGFSSGPPGQCPVTGVRSGSAETGPTALYGPDVDGDRLPGLYEELRQVYGPVAPVSVAPGINAWLVLGYHELLRLTRDEQDFSHDPRRWRLLRENRVPADSPILPMVGWRPALLFSDGQQHRRMRAAVSTALSGINGHELRRLVRDTAEQIIHSFAATGRADLVADYARQLPMRVITALLGVDERTGRQLVEALAGTVAATSASADASRRVGAILDALIKEKRLRPGHDVTSALLHHPAQLTDDEVLHNLVVMFVAGNQTTVNWIATTLRVLLCDPQFRSSLTGGRLSVDDALDLVLWRFPPTQNFPARYATRDMVFGGRQIRTGDMLILGLAAANMDPAILPDDGGPVVGNRAHLAFGAGPHLCPAQDPARLITRTAVDTILHRLPDLELSIPQEQLEWIKSPWSKGLAALPVTFTDLRRRRPSDAQEPSADAHPPAVSPSHEQESLR
ncbi:Cytochrome P450 107B1 [Streptomyces sp. YIM 130001]|uniref:cytochrome P450 n=1 Tax=Streptomyces sp. YIM 130001 TaxID=2259644 RepID=UPI000EDDF084|nr:cytochrome P450 [Streptomyces sp. YIM 130001]RII13079.1 Cytochrome P450 107B1 [Streptomyces sp. YIM 130001]